VQALNAGAGAYASTEAASAGSLQTLAQNLPVPNAAVSVGGFTLLRLGSATASSQPFTSGTAIALGAHSDARATGFSGAVAIGTNSLAEASSLNSATAFGTNSVADAQTVNGFFNLASGMGTNSTATAAGSLGTASAVGTNSAAVAGPGSNNFASVVGPDSTAFAGGTSSAVPGSFTVASVVGTNSTAHASGNLTVFGTGGLAVVFGSALHAAATGNVVINIVTPLFNLVASPFLA
jgi:hypothetical protein